jgi:hypothetical protein
MQHLQEITGATNLELQVRSEETNGQEPVNTLTTPDNQDGNDGNYSEDDESEEEEQLPKGLNECARYLQYNTCQIGEPVNVQKVLSKVLSQENTSIFPYSNGVTHRFAQLVNCAVVH